MIIVRLGVMESPEFIELVISELLKCLDEQKNGESTGDVCKRLAKKIACQARFTIKQNSCTFWSANNQPLIEDTIKYMFKKRDSNWVVRKSD